MLRDWKPFASCADFCPEGKRIIGHMCLQIRTARGYDVETDNTLQTRKQLGGRLQRRPGASARLAWRSLPAGEADQLEREFWARATEDRSLFVAIPGEGSLIDLNRQPARREKARAAGRTSTLRSVPLGKKCTELWPT